MPARRPRLLYLVTLAEVGGAQSYVRDLLPAAEHEFEVTVAAYGEGPLRDACVERGIPFVPLRHIRRDISLPRDLVGLLELVRLFRRIRPDIIHLNSSKAGVLGRIAGTLARVPVVVFTAHGWAFKAATGIRANLYLWSDRLVRRLTTMTICVSEIERAAGLEARTCSAERSTVITNAVDVDAALPHVAGEDDRVRIVSVGRLAQPKDFPGLIAAAAQLRPGTTHIRILGDGPQRPELEGLIAQHNLDDTVELVGEVPDVRPYLAAADIFVLSTHSEGMPIAVLEAMAAGLPVVTSNVSGLHEVVVNDQTGLLAPPDDPRALAATLNRLIDDPDLRHQLGDNGRRRAEDHFSLAPWRTAHLHLYHQLLGARGRSAERLPRLLYLVTLAEVGGAQSYVRDLLPAAEQEFEVTVAAYGEGPLRDACVERGIPFVPLRHVRRDISLPRDLVGLLELVRLFRRIRPDIIHLNSSKAGVLGRIAGTLTRVPVVVFTAHGWAFKATFGLRSRLYLWGDRLVRRLTTMTICVSATDRSEGIAARTCREDRSTVITNAVDVDAALPHVAGEDDRVRIVSVARLTAQKDFPGLIAAAAQLRPGTTHIRILGDGPQRPELEGLIAQHNLDDTVELVGEVPDVRPYLAAADIFVLSTHSEGMPIAVLEAMAAGLPVVTSNVSGLHEVVVNDQTGLLAPPDDPRALAATLNRLIDDPDLRHQLGDNGRRRAEDHFSLAPWRTAHLHLYHQLLAASEPALATT